MARIEKLDFKEAFPEELKNTSVPDFFWGKFSESDFPISWETAFKGYEELDAMQRLIRNFTLPKLRDLLGEHFVEVLTPHFPIIGYNHNHGALEVKGIVENGIVTGTKLGKISKEGVETSSHSIVIDQLQAAIAEQQESFNKLSPQRKGEILEQHLLANRYGEYTAVPHQDIRNFGNQFRFRVQESISKKLPFNDYILHDPQGGNPARSPIFTGTAIPFSINNLATAVTSIPKRKKKQLKE